MKPIKRAIAGVGALAIATAGIAVVGTTEASAADYSGSDTISCRFYGGDTGVGSSPTTLGGTRTLTLSPASPAPSQTVTATLTGTTGGNTGPADVEANTLRLEAILDVNGSPLNLSNGTPATPPNGSTVGTSGVGVYPASTVLAGGNALPAWSLSGTFSAPASGTITVTFKRLRFDAVATGGLLAGNADTYCSDSNGVDIDHANAAVLSDSVIATTNVDSRTVVSTAVTNQSNAAAGRGAYSVDPDGPGPAPATPVAGEVVTLSFNDQWGAGSAPVELCDTNGTTGCQSLGSVTLTGATAETKTVTLGSGLTTGSRTIRVTDPVSSANKKTTPFQVLTARFITLSPTGGGAGTVVTVSGSGFTTGASVALEGKTSVFAPSGDSGSFTASSTGAIPALTTVTVNSSTTAYIVANESLYTGASDTLDWSNPAAFSYSSFKCVAQAGDTTGGPGCGVNSNVDVTVTAGKLVMRQYLTEGNATGAGLSGTSTPLANSSSTKVNLGTIETPLAPTVITGRLNDVTITDNRGGSNIWTLSAAMTTPLTKSGGVTIANGQLKVNPTCVKASASTAYDYNQSIDPANTAARTTVAGYVDPWGAATGGLTASGNVALSGTVNLCTKDGSLNTNATTSGIFNMSSPLELTLPAFQATGLYTGVLRVTLV